MLLLRILSALVGIPVVLGSVYLGGQWYALFILLVANLAVYEYNYIFNSQGYRLPALLSFLGVSLFIVILFLEQYLLILPLIMLVFFLLYVTVIFTMERKSIVEAALTLWGVIYLGGLFGFMLMLRMLPEGALYTYLLLAGVWIHDTLAYFIGVRWGVRKFAPQISPKKSVEGSLAGICGTVIIFFSASILFPDLLPVNPIGAVFLSAGIAVFAQLGDLLESALKRQLQIKDTGSIIPGHGGILDRFDSLLLAAPFVYYFFILFNML